MTRKEIYDRINDKANAQLFFLKLDIEKKEDQIAKGQCGSVGPDLVRLEIGAANREIEVWTEIKRMNELKNFGE